MNQIMKLASRKHQYYRWVPTSTRSDKSAVHWGAPAHLIKELQLIVQHICEKNSLDCFLFFIVFVFFIDIIVVNIVLIYFISNNSLVLVVPVFKMFLVISV